MLAHDSSSQGLYPLYYKEKIEAELTCLQNEGVIEPVQFSKWATPVVKSESVGITKPL